VKNRFRWFRWWI